MKELRADPAFAKSRATYILASTRAAADGGEGLGLGAKVGRLACTDPAGAGGLRPRPELGSAML